MSYIDLITRIKNAQMARKEGLKVPFSINDMAVAELLEKKGFVKGVEKKGRMPKRVIYIKLKYKDGENSINGIKLFSKPSRRLYSGYRDLKKTKHGYGTGVISTPKGIMTTDEARQQKVGGELLFEIW